MRWLFFAGCVALAGCAEPTGPVLGDWRGSQPSLDPYHSRTVELILDGTPDSVSGTYHLLTLVMTPDLGGQDNQNLRWTDRWEKRVLTDGTGARIITIHLHHAPDTQLSDYLLSSNGLLVPLIHPEHPDLSPEAMRIALVPLPRTAWGYGRP